MYIKIILNWISYMKSKKSGVMESLYLYSEQLKLKMYKQSSVPTQY